ncbi:hypothetical protein NA57DRAFT_13940, partial [Rhizodiscina lignyota]
FRVSLACIQCRSRHLRCDAVSPICSRCRDSGSECTYQKSRRGGRPKIQNRTAQQTPFSSFSTSPLPALDRRLSASAPAGSLLTAFQLAETNAVPCLVSDKSDGTFPGTPSSIGHCLSYNPDDRWHDWNAFMDLYYIWFHDAQPCVLPPEFMKLRLKEAPPDLKVLVLAMKYIGSRFVPRISSESLERAVEDELAKLSASANRFEVQALVLLSTAVYWNNDLRRARELLNRATAKALNLGMNLKEFAAERCGGDSVLAESMRRTWWQLYFTDAHTTWSNHETFFGSSQRYTPATVELPCEDLDYNSGNIPKPKTLEDYDNREFALEEDTLFSSFAYVIGLVRSLDHVAAGIPRDSVEHVKEISANTDAAIGAWQSLLCKSKRKLFRDDGSLDELMYKANTLIEVYVVDMHRFLSTLVYSPIEAISSCAPPPPPNAPQQGEDRDAFTHTKKILLAIERMTALLTLPTNMAAHTPFTICMVATVTIGHLSACNHVLKGEQLKIARERIRVAIGALEAFAEVWPRGKKVLREVKLVARELLGLDSQRNSP